MSANLCHLCGVDMSVWGRMHTCRPLSTVVTAASAKHLANETSDDTRVANKTTDELANEQTAPGRNRSSTTYRYRNPDKRRAYQRDLMRRRRATGRAA